MAKNQNIISTGAAQKLHHGHHALHQAHTSLGDLVSVLTGHWEVILLGGLLIWLIFYILGAIAKLTLKAAAPGDRPAYGRPSDGGYGRIILSLGFIVFGLFAPSSFMSLFIHPATQALGTIGGFGS